VPTYEMECKEPDCLHQWEVEQRVIEEPIKQCPKCGRESARRLISKTSFVLNGTGWFKTGGY
jgi:putative FmdB family regulatory protein